MSVGRREEGRSRRLRRRRRSSLFLRIAEGVAPFPPL